MERRSRDSGRKVINSMGRTTTTSRITIAIWIVVFSLFGTAFAQQPVVVSTRIGTAPPGLRVEVSVDGQTYVTPVTLLWPATSKHTICLYDQLDVTGNTKWRLAGSGSCGIFTAVKDLPEITLSVNVSYLIKVVFAVCVSDSPGPVFAFTCTGSFYAPAG